MLTLSNWDFYASSYEDFPWVLKLKENLTLSQQEEWFFPVFELDIAVTLNGKHMDEILLDTLIKAEVYYGSEKPIITEIRFEKPKR